MITRNKQSSRSRALQLFEPPPDAIYSIEAAAHLVDVPRRKIAVYCRYGLLTPLANEGGYYFDGRSIKTLRVIEELRSVCGDDLAGIKMILRLMNELQRLNSEVHSLNRETTRTTNRRIKKYERRPR
jgi:DNA-binding transcriptional MerR regulator